MIPCCCISDTRLWAYLFAHKKYAHTYTYTLLLLANFCLRKASFGPYSPLFQAPVGATLAFPCFPLTLLLYILLLVFVTSLHLLIVHVPSFLHRILLSSLRKKKSHRFSRVFLCIRDDSDNLWKWHAQLVQWAAYLLCLPSSFRKVGGDATDTVLGLWVLLLLSPVIFHTLQSMLAWIFVTVKAA